MSIAHAPKLNTAFSDTSLEHSRAAPAWQSSYPPEAWAQIWKEGSYLAGVLVCAVIVTIVLLKMNLHEHHQIVEKMLCCALGGITGSWIYSVKWFVRVISKGIWRKDLIAWRLASPFMGIFLAVSAYAVIQAGFFGVTFSRNQDIDERLYAYAIGFLVGLFADVVMGKLAEVAETLFGRAQKQEVG